MIEMFIGQHRWLSNFYPVPVDLDGTIYPSVEHAYQAAKAARSTDRELIRTAPSPGAAKRLGCIIRIRDDWNERLKLEIMEELVRDKFSKEPFKSLLIETGDEKIIEGNTWGDRFWGMCEGKGENHLGKIIMKVRDELLRA